MFRKKLNFALQSSANSTPAKKVKAAKMVTTPKTVEPEQKLEPELIVDVICEKTPVKVCPSFVAVKSIAPPPSSPLPSALERENKNVSALGVGTFSIDRDTAKRKFASNSHRCSIS